MLKEKFVFNYQNVRERNASFEMDEILARWSSDFSYEMLKCHNRLKDDIIVSTAENIENTFERCKREIQDRSSSLLRKDEITIKNYLFLSHKDHEIFKKWESNASHHFLFIRDNSTKRNYTKEEV